MLVTKIQCVIPCEACFNTEEYTTAEEGRFTTLSKEPLAKFLVWGENQVDLELTPVANGMGRATVHGDPTTLLYAPHVRQLVFNERWYRDSPLSISVCALPHQLFMYCSVFCSLTQKGEQYSSTRCDDQQHEMRGFEVYDGDTSMCTTLQLLHHSHRLHQELSAYPHILRVCS